MAKSRVPSLAQLEKRLATLNAERHKVIVTIKAVAAGLAAGATHLTESERREFGPAARRASTRTRKFSKAARARLAAAARKRWAEAKKAGRKKLG